MTSHTQHGGGSSPSESVSSLCFFQEQKTIICSSKAADQRFSQNTQLKDFLGFQFPNIFPFSGKLTICNELASTAL